MVDIIWFDVMETSQSWLWRVLCNLLDVQGLKGLLSDLKIEKAPAHKMPLCVCARARACVCLSVCDVSLAEPG